MYVRKPDGPLFVVLPDGTRMSRGDLPPPTTRRWVASRKLKVVHAVNGGLISTEEACSRYGLSEEELGEWIRAAARAGAAGLKATVRLRD